MKLISIGVFIVIISLILGVCVCSKCFIDIRDSQEREELIFQQILLQIQNNNLEFGELKITK